MVHHHWTVLQELHQADYIPLGVDVSLQRLEDWLECGTRALLLLSLVGIILLQINTILDYVVVHVFRGSLHAALISERSGAVNQLLLRKSHDGFVANRDCRFESSDCGKDIGGRTLLLVLDQKSDVFDAPVELCREDPQ